MTFDPRDQSAHLSIGCLATGTSYVQCVGVEVDKKLNFQSMLIPLTSTITVQIFVSSLRFRIVFLTKLVET